MRASCGKMVAGTRPAASPVCQTDSLCWVMELHDNVVRFGVINFAVAIQWRPWAIAPDLLRFSEKLSSSACFARCVRRLLVQTEQMAGGGGACRRFSESGTLVPQYYWYYLCTDRRFNRFPGPGMPSIRSGAYRPPLLAYNSPDVTLRTDALSVGHDPSSHGVYTPHNSENAS
eukprot:1609308-Rhodomonas_salina.2